LKTIIAGVRQVKAPGAVPRELYFHEVVYILGCLNDYHRRYPISEVVSGGAKGVDKLGEAWALRHGVKLTRFLPDYKKHSLGAPFLRNRSMGEYADRAIMFWDECSTGTKHMIGVMEQLDKPKTIWRLDYFA
jgi:hypothetical protein